MKICTSCGVEQSLDQFSKKLKGLQPACKTCVKKINREQYIKNRDARLAYQKEHYQLNAEEIKQYGKNWRKANLEYTKNYDRLRKYGLTPEEFFALLDSQNHCCAICDKPLTKTLHTHVDHNHATGLVRGVLCHGCNTGIGLFKESILSLEKAIQYLQRNQGESV